MTAAAVAWQRWCHQDPELAVVDDLLDLPEWTRRASTATKDLDLLAGLPELHPDAVFESSHLVQQALIAGVLSLPEASLLQELADAADERSAPARRGRAGLTSPAVVEYVTCYHPTLLERHRHTPQGREPAASGQGNPGWNRCVAEGREERRETEQG